MLEIIQYLDDHNGAIMVIITAIYVIATIAICIANLRSAKATRDQLEESKRQYEEEHRAFISYELIYENRNWYGVRFTNYGKRVAFDVQIHLDASFVDSLTDEAIKKDLIELDVKAFLLGIGQSYDIFFGDDTFRKRLNKIPIRGTIKYADRRGEYSDVFNIDFEKYPPLFTVETGGERIERAIKTTERSITNIANVLKRMDTHLTQQGKNEHDVI